jgi:putative intracellular protease/amidase
VQRKKVGIVIFNDAEVLDFCGPFEVFSATRQNEALRREEESPFELLLIAQTSHVITTTGGLKVLPHLTFEACPPLDILVVPGGWGTRAEMKNELMLSFVKAQTQH